MKTLYLIALVTAFLQGCTDQGEAGQNSVKLDMQLQELRALLDEIETPDDEEQAGLLVQLVFSSDADLDLYVTDPLLETVYFANNKTRSGGEITKDLKCDAGELSFEKMRVEEVRFKTPLPGRYRVGVDFPEHCQDQLESAAFLIAATHGGKTEEASGSVLFQQFKVVAMEFEVNKTEDDKSRIVNEIN